MTLIEIIQKFCFRQSLPVPNTAFNSTDKGVLQLMHLLEEVCIDAASRGFWESLVYEANWTSVAAEDQGLMTTLAPQGFRYILNKTIWDRTQQLPLYGPLSPQEWQGLKAMVVSGPQYQWRIRQGHLIVNPALPVNHQMFFEYMSSWWAEEAGSGYDHFMSDNSTLRLPDDVMLVGLRWKWKKEKGFDYAEEFNLYERMVNDSMVRTGGGKDIHMDETAEEGPMPGIYVPWGNWLQP